MQAPAAAAVGGPMPVFRRAVTAYRLPRSQASAPAGTPTPYPTGPPSPAWVPPAPAPAGWNPNPGPGASRATTASRPRLRTVTQLRVVRPAAPALLPGLRDAPGQRGYTVHPDRPITQDAPDPAMIRLDLGDHEFLIADFSGGARTLNWTTEVTPSEFIAIVDEYIATSPEPGRMSVSLNGLMEDVDPEFAVSLAVLSTSSFDKACDFARLDLGSFSMAFQVIPHDRREALRVFGLSAPDLDLTSVFPLIVRTGSRQAVAHALRLGPDSLTGRLARILAAGGTDAQPPQED
jgi:hypothetical protein